MVKEMLRLDDNTEIRLFDAQGKPKQLWTDNRLGRWLRKRGLFVEMAGLTGRYGYVAHSHNLITNAGHAAAAGRISGQGSFNAFANLALGSGSTAAAVTDTALVTEITTNGGARGAATASLVTTSVTNDTVQLAKSWTFTGTLTVNEEGIFDNAASGGTLLARQIIGPYTVNNGDVLTITHKVQA